ncbi:hypothetical protein CEV34_4211 [Brucella pseudogrignonensis]|uniref:Uncharacterized protein n=1 Tax=Brucella pseudogrignonensis TaxID=419475 RepID=A0A256G6V6_9HYPH|nr:hypothetical protein CEV34_4211 [Brucella pseudogrignonensis]
MALHPPRFALGNLELGKSRKQPGCRPTFGVSALSEAMPSLCYTWEPQISEH